MYSKTFLEIKYRHLAVFDWTIEHSLSCFSERVCTGTFLGGGAHFVVYAIGGAPLLNSLFYCGSHNEFCFFTNIAVLRRSNLGVASVCPVSVLHFFGQSKNGF